jgi:hypothetical protein
VCRLWQHIDERIDSTGAITATTDMGRKAKCRATAQVSMQDFRRSTRDVRRRRLLENGAPSAATIRRTTQTTKETPTTEVNDDENDQENERPARRKKARIDRVAPTTGATSGGPSSIYRCRLCEYSTVQTTMMKHHAMSHVRYYPYTCPYCDERRSVRSFPVLDHVRTKHSDLEVRYAYEKDDDMEKKIKETFYLERRSSNGEQQGRTAGGGGRKLRTDAGKAETIDERSNDRVTTTVAAAAAAAATTTSLTTTPSVNTLAANAPKRVVFKCKTCGSKSLFRNDMRHHIMRELQYKPFRYRASCSVRY